MTADPLRALVALERKWRSIPQNQDIEYSDREFIAGYDKALNDCADELAAALSQAGVVPDGWVLVPREPTPEMLRPLAHRGFQEHWDAGKKLQRDQMTRSSAAGSYGYQDWMIPPKTEYEVAAGQYLAMLAAAPAAQGVAAAGLSKCRITGRPFFENIDHPKLGLVATYGGPFDSYTIPALHKPDDELRCERYDHDAGRWIEGGEPLGYFYSEQQPPAAPAVVVDEAMVQRAIDAPVGLNSTVGDMLHHPDRNDDFKTKVWRRSIMRAALAAALGQEVGRG